MELYETITTFIAEIGNLMNVPGVSLVFIGIIFLILCIGAGFKLYFMWLERPRKNAHGHICRRRRRGIRKYYISCPGIDPKFETFDQCFQNGQCEWGDARGHSWGKVRKSSRKIRKFSRKIENSMELLEKIDDKNASTREAGGENRTCPYDCLERPCRPIWTLPWLRRRAH